jgi:hypothetical protein
MENRSQKPATQKEAIDCILAYLSEKQREEIRSMSLSDFVVQGHWGLGLWIRNELIYGNPHRERLEAELLGGDKSLHPDDLSGKLLAEIWKDLKGSKT